MWGHSVLTEMKCRNAKVEGREQKLFDSGGLHLLVKPTGYKSWRLKYRYGGKERQLTFARPTVVSLLSKARAYGLVDWVRRTESTDNRYGPQRRQISNAYFFEVTRLPIEALRRLRQLLAKKKAEALEWPDRQGSGPVPNRNQRLASRIVRATAGMIGSAASALDRSWREKADQMRDRSPTEQAAILYPDDPASQREHLEMLGLSASSDSAPVHPSPRTNTS